MNGPEKKPETTHISITLSPMVKGLGALIVGILLILCSFKMILHILLFIGGAFLIYYGLVILQIKQATDYINFVIDKLKSLLSKH